MDAEEARPKKEQPVLPHSFQSLERVRKNFTELERKAALHAGRDEFLQDVLPFSALQRIGFVQWSEFCGHMGPDVSTMIPSRREVMRNRAARHRSGFAKLRELLQSPE